MAERTFNDASWTGDGEPALDVGRFPRSAMIPLLAIVYGIGLALFLAVEPTQPWILLVVVALVGLGTDGILRSHPAAQLRGPADTAPFLFVPVLLALAAGLFLEELLDGYEAVPGAVGAGVLLALAVYGESATAVAAAPSYATGRLLLNVITYLSAFAFYAVVYSFDVDLLPAAFAVGLFSTLLAVELFREAEADAYRALVFAGAIGVVAAEARWALYFLPLEDFLAAVLLLLVFYLSTGLVQHHLTGHLDRHIAGEFGAVSAIGIAVVVLGRVFGLD
jgi:hypothetical protein